MVRMPHNRSNNQLLVPSCSPQDSPAIINSRLSKPNSLRIMDSLRATMAQGLGMLSSLYTANNKARQTSGH
jgi:hypothetical protein